MLLVPTELYITGTSNMFSKSNQQAKNNLWIQTTLVLLQTTCSEWFRLHVWTSDCWPVVGLQYLWSQREFFVNRSTQRKTLELRRRLNEGGFNRLSKRPIVKSSIAFSDSECPVIWSVWVQATYFVVMALLVGSSKRHRPIQPGVVLAAWPSLLIDRAASPLVFGQLFCPHV